MTPGPNGCTCGHNGDCNCGFVASAPSPPPAKKAQGKDYRAIARDLQTVLRRIARGYMTPEQLRRAIERPRDPHYGLSYEDALKMAHENIQAEANAAMKRAGRL